MLNSLNGKKGWDNTPRYFQQLLLLFIVPGRVTPGHPQYASGLVSISRVVVRESLN